MYRGGGYTRDETRDRRRSDARARACAARVAVTAAQWVLVIATAVPASEQNARTGEKK